MPSPQQNGRTHEGEDAPAEPPPVGDVKNDDHSNASRPADKRYLGSLLFDKSVSSAPPLIDYRSSSSLDRARDRPRSGFYDAPVSPSTTFPSPPLSPSSSRRTPAPAPAAAAPAQPRKLRRKSHSSPLSSPPASPRTSTSRDRPMPPSPPQLQPRAKAPPARAVVSPAADERAFASPARLARRLEEVVVDEDEGEGREVDLEVTAQDRHYISRMLVNLQLQHEFSALSSIGTLSAYGPPFLPHANGPNSRPAPPPKPQRTGSARLLGLLTGGGGGEGKDKDKDVQFAGYVWDKSKVGESPVCQYLYWSAQDSYWHDWQQFIDSFAERDLSSTVERGEVTKRRMLSFGIVRVLGTYVSVALPAVPGPSVPARPSTTMMRQLDLLVPGDMDGMARVLLGERGAGEAPMYNAWVAVLETESGTEREPTYRVLSRVLVAPDQPLFTSTYSLSSLRSFASQLASLDPRNKLQLPHFPSTASPTLPALQTYVRWVVIALSAPPAALGRSTRDADLLSSARGALESFLLSSGPLQSGPQLEEARHAEQRVREADGREEEKASEWVKVGKRVKRLRTTWVRYRAALIHGDEFDQSIAQVKKHSRLDKLPEQYRDAEEWARIWVANALHYIFVGAATGPEMLNILRSFHELIPYGAIKLGLNLVNPTLIWSHVCNSANKHQRKLIEEFRKKLGNESICDALRAHVQEGYVGRQKTKQAALDRDEDIVLTILRERGTPAEYDVVSGWHGEFERALEHESLLKAEKRATNGAARSKGAEKFAELKELLAAYYRFRDREQVLAIALEANTPRLLHASIAVFYSTVHAVANASKLSDRVGDLQAFLDDLVKTCESGKTEPSDFIALAGRHDQSLYYFVHELAAAGDLLDPLLDWARSGLRFLRTGVPSSASSRPSTKRAGVEVDALLASLPSRGPESPAGASKESQPPTAAAPSSAPSQESVLREARAFARWTALKKTQHDLDLRVDLLLAASSSPPTWVLQLSKRTLWHDYLETLPPPLVRACEAAAKQQHEQAKRTGPGGDLEWACWWAERETHGAAGRDGVVVAHRESAKEAVAKGNGASDDGRKGKMKRHGSSGISTPRSPADSPVPVAVDELKVRLAVPTPQSEATRGLLGGYIAQLREALSEARRREIK
ncbi:hypothetical protein Rhopal_007050-T1 [Rhodotorula paludigena]|uniref:Uncharacterized protein n=1 Tax=Rhodotorula paludigena TaxID=86838 RepID=A0AAV5GXB9_9BASI|nr:hypothetical protein Rhopal_007050-T1 [Rhodotorula paludigena]